MQVSNHTFIDIKVVDMNAAVQGRFQYSVGSVLGELKVPWISERRIRNAYLNELQLRTTCPINSSKKWWDTTYVLYDLVEPPSKTDCSEWEF
ncbi:unnamed protein product [Penicillium palitans]